MSFSQEVAVTTEQNPETAFFCQPFLPPPLSCSTSRNPKTRKRLGGAAGGLPTAPCQELSSRSLQACARSGRAMLEPLGSGVVPPRPRSGLWMAGSGGGGQVKPGSGH